MKNGTIASVLWRRLDVPGHDACHLEQTPDGWLLSGAAAFREDGAVASLQYLLACNETWTTLEGTVRGRFGTRPVDFLIERSPDGPWMLNGNIVPGLDGCVDLDFGFTPATNLSQVRRLSLAEGQSADVPVAWLDVAAGTLDILHQRYERRSVNTYWYASPRFGYSAMLEFDATGFASCYPGLWESEPAAP